MSADTGDGTNIFERTECVDYMVGSQGIGMGEIGVGRVKGVSSPV